MLGTRLLLSCLAVSATSAWLGGSRWQNSSLAASVVPNMDLTLTDKLVQLMQEKAYDGFLEELAAPGMKVNQPTSNGQLPLNEAVLTQDVRFADALIQHQADVAASDPATGMQPLMLACRTAQAKMARLLASYGASFDAEDKAGDKARNYAPNQELHDMIRAVDEEGPAALEDEPGTWRTHRDDQGKSYWVHRHGQDSRWSTPPSCGWTRLEDSGQSPHRYFNSVTKQNVHSLPKALAWALATVDGSDVWYNWRSNHSQFEEPAELPADLLSEAMEMKNQRWYNPSTQAYSWEDPHTSGDWSVLHSAEHDRAYYHNVRTKETTWEVPDEHAWEKLPNPRSNEDTKHYWWNKVTGESQWHDPDHKAWVLRNVDSEL